MDVAISLQKEISLLCPIRDAKKIMDKWDELNLLMQKVMYVYQQVRLIHTATKSTLTHKITKLHQSLDILDGPETITEELSDVKVGEREIAPGVPIRAVEVSTAEMIPDMPIHYITSSGEWGIRIMGKIITGQVGEIRSNGKKHIRCHHKSHDQSRCPLWHPGEPIGWLQSHWIHTNQPSTAKNYYMRHAGSRSTLRYDVQRLSQKEISVRNKQLIHDLLVYLACP